VVAVLIFSFVATWIIAKVVDATVGLRADDDAEAEGLDISIHEERAYVLSDSR
jgi:Amt family ammonium transporter